MYAIAIHGGAGTIDARLLNPELQLQYEAALQAALDEGYRLLAAGASALDAVSAAVVVLEDCPLFNAGRGAVFSHEGRQELDASVMRGDTGEAGAVCGVHNVRNPVLLARLVMERSQHVLLSGAGAELFGREQEIVFEGDRYFFDAFRYEQYQAALAAGTTQLDHTPAGDRKFSTVGAVALDQSGHVCAATSTGGMTNKKYGRIGDTPLIGAGTYASNKTCAVSCTGHGELFIRQVAAHQVHCLMLYKGLSLQQACDEVVLQDLVAIGAEGGMIAIDRAGNIAMPFNTAGMYRGFKKSDGTTAVGIYR